MLSGTEFDLDCPYFDGIFPYFHLLSSIQVEASRYAWHKQEVLKGMNSPVGTKGGGWSFHCRERGFKVYSTGGLLMENSSVLIGADAERFVENFNADVCFLSCKGVSNDGKLTDTSYFETQLRKKFLQNSKLKVMLITKNKFNKEYIHTLCKVDEVDYVITDD